MKCKIINGPNLNLLGKRETDIYGTVDFETHLQELRQRFPELKIDYFQSNMEGSIIDDLQESDKSYDAIVLNAGGYSHTSVAIADAIASIGTPVIEVHITNIMNREVFREKSLISAKCRGSISGFGLFSYDLALYYVSAYLSA
ncbi:MAG: type II 3-dehydroquinate dehydratase [Vicingaceae bacterium]